MSKPVVPRVRDEENDLTVKTVTPRELEVLALVAKGYSTAEIAKELWITPETVQTHVKRMLRRLGARSRAHAVAIAYCEDLWENLPGDDV